MKISLLALVLGFLIDLLAGDPSGMYHPVRLIGNLISFLEQRMNHEEDSPEKQMICGMGMAAAVIVITAVVPLLILLLAEMIHPLVRLVVETVMCWLLLAVRSLKTESMKVYHKLKRQDLPGSRRAVSMIVGRDTENLDAAGVARAAVETVAENASDGIIAPMFYMAIGGAYLGWIYKAINTMDSMVGYKNDRYQNFGCIPAMLDDVVNYIPARLSGLFMVAASYAIGFDGAHAFEIFKRDRYNHASPNSAQTEAVMAGALNVQLAGDAWYFGKLHKKKTIGDNNRPIEVKDIVRANKLLYATSITAMIVFVVVKGIFIAIL